MNTSGKSLLQVTVTAAIGGATLVSAILVSYLLVSMREPPAQTQPPEPSLAVELIRMSPEDVPMRIVGFGDALPIEIVPIAPQVSGKVVHIHERLFAGEVIAAGETLVQIDPRDYEANLAQVRAQVAQARSGLARLRTQYASDKERLGTLERNRDLAKKEYERLRGLFEEEQVGALSNVERTEMSYNQARDALDMMTQNISLYPPRIAEAEQGLAAAEAALQLAELNLERTTIKAPFDARIQEKKVEEGQSVSPGAPILMLANDSILEITVPLDSRDVRAGLRFSETDEGNAGNSWFGAVEPVECRVFWTEAPDSQFWTGRLDRVVAFDQTTRTITVAIRLSAEEAQAGASKLPLVAGMFCRVEIPGAVMKQVYRLPRWSVTFENQVYIAEDGRLTPRDVSVLRTQNDQAFIESGLETDDLVIMTRLLNPLPNAKIDYEVEAIILSTDMKESVDGEAAL